MNAVTKPAGGALALSQLRANLAQVRNRVPDAGGTPYLRMLTDGDWVFGAENNAVVEKDGALVVFNTLSIKQGFSCWTDRPGNAKNEPKGEELVGLGEPAVTQAELPKYYDDASGPNALPWKASFSIDVKFVDGKYEGQQVLWKNNSTGGLRAFSGLLDAIMARVDEGSDYVFPMVELSSDHYQHKAHGRTWFPVLDIVGWMDNEGNEDPDFVLPEDEPEAAPAKPARREIAAPAAEAPRRRARGGTDTPEDRKPEPETEQAQAQAPELEAPEAPEAPAADGAVRRRRRG